MHVQCVMFCVLVFIFALGCHFFIGGIDFTIILASFWETSLFEQNGAPLFMQKQIWLMDSLHVSSLLAMITMSKVLIDIYAQTNGVPLCQNHIFCYAAALCT